jgi:hypothetical protein
MASQPTPPPTDPIQEVAELPERSRLILQTTGVDPARTAARTIRMPLEQLKRDSALWAAYIRGWEDRTADNHRIFRASQPNMHRQTVTSRSARGETVACHTPQTRPVSLAKAQPLPVPQARAPPRPVTRAHWWDVTPTSSATSITTPAPLHEKQLTKRQQRDKARLKEYLAMKNRRGTVNNDSKQNWTSPAPSPPPLFRDNTVVDGQLPVGSATIGHATTMSNPNPPESTSEEMDISPEEEKICERGFANGHGSGVPTGSFTNGY